MGTVWKGFRGLEMRARIAGEQGAGRDSQSVMKACLRAGLGSGRCPELSWAQAGRCLGGHPPQEELPLRAGVDTVQQPWEERGWGEGPPQCPNPACFPQPASRCSPEGALAGHRDAPANGPKGVPPSPAAQPRTLSSPR